MFGFQSRLPRLTNETLVHTCTGEVEVVAGHVPRDSIIPVPTGIDKSLRELGDKNLGVWTASSCKEDFGVDKLRDFMKGTYWQSEGNLPHKITVAFHKKMDVSAVYLYVLHKLDESYCPKKVVVRIGDPGGSMIDVTREEFKDPQGWVKIPVKLGGKPVTTRLLEIVILENYQSGKDTHIRHMNIYGPKNEVFTLGSGIYCQSPEFKRWLFPR